MATEQELRNEIRKHVRKMLAESTGNSFIKNVGSQVRASLGGGRTMLDKALGGMDVERLAKLPRMQKVGLLTTLMKTFGITADELTALRGQVARGLKADSPKSESKLKEAYFSPYGNDEPSLRDAKKALANWFKNSIEIGMQGQPLKRSTFDILHDLIDDYAMEYARDYADNLDMEEGKLNEVEFGSNEKSGVGGALASKGEKVEKTQAYQMLVKAIDNKPATQQVAFVIDMLSKLPLDDSAKRMLKMKIKSQLQ